MPALLQEWLACYQLKGRILKQVTKDIDDKVDGLVCGLAAEVLEDESVVVYKMNRRTDPVTATPWLKWSSGDVQEESGKAIEISYILPENRLVGVLIHNEAEKILIPLRFSWDNQMKIAILLH
jgi:hypothetical protein